MKIQKKDANMAQISNEALFNRMNNIIRFVKGRYDRLVHDMSMGTYLSNELNYCLPEDVSEMLSKYGFRWYYLNEYLFF